MILFHTKRTISIQFKVSIEKKPETKRVDIFYLMCRILGQKGPYQLFGVTKEIVTAKHKS